MYVYVGVCVSDGFSETKYTFIQCDKNNIGRSSRFFIPCQWHMLMMISFRSKIETIHFSYDKDGAEVMYNYWFPAILVLYRFKTKSSKKYNFNMYITRCYFSQILIKPYILLMFILTYFIVLKFLKYIIRNSFTLFFFIDV